MRDDNRPLRSLTPKRPTSSPLSVFTASTDWMLEGNCVIPSAESGLTDEQRTRMMKEVDNALFPDIPTGPNSGNEWDAGRALCDGCPILQRCGQYAIENRIPAGMWGGLTPDERQPQPEAEIIYLPETEAALFAIVTPASDTGEDEIPHGTPTGYKNWRCRCEECSAANREYYRQQREKAKYGLGARSGWHTWPEERREQRREYRRQRWAAQREAGASREERKKAA